LTTIVKLKLLPVLRHQHTSRDCLITTAGICTQPKDEHYYIVHLSYIIIYGGTKTIQLR